MQLSLERQLKIYPSKKGSISFHGRSFVPGAGLTRNNAKVRQVPIYIYPPPSYAVDDADGEIVRRIFF